METFAEPQPEVIAEQKLTLNIKPNKERNLRILYVLLGVGVILLVVGLILIIML